jgi:hypothetical protein
MIDVQEVISALSRCSDGASRFVLRELNTAMRDTRNARDYNLLYAPVWERSYVEKILYSIEDRGLRSIALQANTTVHEVGERQRLFAGDNGERGRLERAIAQFGEAISHLPGPAGDLDFYLRAEMLYARLLITRITNDAGAKQSELTRLVHQHASFET